MSSGVQWHDRHDVGRSDARVSSLMHTEIDALDRDGDPCDQRVGKLGLRSDEREHRTVVIGVRVDVE